MHNLIQVFDLLLISVYNESELTYEKFGDFISRFKNVNTIPNSNRIKDAEEMRKHNLLYSANLFLIVTELSL